MKKEYIIIGAVVLTIGYFIWRNNQKINDNIVGVGTKNVKENDATKNGFPFSLDLNKLKNIKSGSVNSFVYDPTNYERNFYNILDGTISIDRTINKKTFNNKEYGTILTGIYNVKDGSFVSFKKEDYVYDPNDPNNTIDEQMYFCQDKNGEEVIGYSPCDNVNLFDFTYDMG